MANIEVRERSDMAKQENLNKYFLKPSRYDGEDGESEIQSEVTDTV